MPGIEGSLLLPHYGTGDTSSPFPDTKPRPVTIGQRLIAKLADGPFCGHMPDLQREIGCGTLELQIVRRELNGENRIVETRCPADRRRVVLGLPGSSGCGHQHRYSFGVVPQEEA